jgi:hemerythrin
MGSEQTDEVFRWNDSYSLGDERVDSQHRCLFDLVNDVVRSCDYGADKEKLKGTLEFMVNYAVQHFDDEEDLQVQCNFPEYEQHKKMHDDFKITVVDLVERFHESGSSSRLSSDVNRLVVRWLLNHIMVEDKKIVRHLQGK